MKGFFLCLFYTVNLNTPLCVINQNSFIPNAENPLSFTGVSPEQRRNYEIRFRDHNAVLKKTISFKGAFFLLGNPKPFCPSYSPVGEDNGGEGYLDYNLPSFH